MSASRDPHGPGRVSPARLAALLGDFPRSPAWSGLAETLQSLVADGRLPHDTRLPSERDLAAVLPVSRTTVTRAYDRLRETGWAQAHVGAGTWTSVPGGPRRATDRALSPRGDLHGRDDLIDLTCAAPAAPPGVAAAYARALEQLPSLLSDHGYFPSGLPELQRRIAQRYTAQGLATAPEQVMVTPGALAATSLAAHALLRPGDRVLVETPVYPNAPAAFRLRGARAVPQPVEARDPAGLAATLSSGAVRAAYLVPDFQNPTGTLVDDTERAALAAALARYRVLAVVDESHRDLALEPVRMPRPFAAHVADAGGRAVTVGGAAKGFWGGLRLGWVRAEPGDVEALDRARLALDLGTPVLEQLALCELLDDAEAVLGEHRARLLAQRDVLVAEVRAQLPDWEFDVPTGGLVLWCRLPAPAATALAAAAELEGVAVTPGPVFGLEGGFRSQVRLPWTQRPEVLVEAVRRLARAWAQVVDQAPSARSPQEQARPVVA